MIRLAHGVLLCFDDFTLREAFVTHSSLIDKAPDLEAKSSIFYGSQELRGVFPPKSPKENLAHSHHATVHVIVWRRSGILWNIHVFVCLFISSFTRVSNPHLQVLSMGWLLWKRWLPGEFYGERAFWERNLKRQTDDNTCFISVSCICCQKETKMNLLRLGSWMDVHWTQKVK